MAEHTNARQIAVYQTNKYLLEANDNLRMVDSGAEASNLHHRFSKIQIVALNYADRSKKANATVNLDPEKLLLLAHDVLTGQFGGFSETKILGHKKRDDGKAAVTKLTVQYEELDGEGKPKKMPWTVTVENGWAIPEQSEMGGTYAKKGTYEADKTEGGVNRSVKVFFSYDDFRMFVMKVQNYVIAWEQAILPFCLKMRSGYEQEQKETQQQSA